MTNVLTTVCGSDDHLQFCCHVIGYMTCIKFLTSHVSLIASFDIYFYCWAFSIKRCFFFLSFSAMIFLPQPILEGILCTSRNAKNRQTFIRFCDLLVSFVVDSESKSKLNIAQMAFQSYHTSRLTIPWPQQNLCWTIICLMEPKIKQSILCVLTWFVSFSETA